MKNNNIKIAIFENEYAEIEGVFEYLNDFIYDGKLLIDVFPNSQSMKDLKLLDAYDMIIIDIDLSGKSELDGYGLLKKMEKEKLSYMSKTIIISGHDIATSVEGIPNFKNIPILHKAIDFYEVEEMIDKIITI